MFGIGGGEIIFIIMVILMLFGSDKIPEIVRGFAKMISQVKNATNEIKNEIQKSADQSGLVNEIKDTLNVDVDPLSDIKDEVNKTQEELNKAKEDIENITGPIKRQR